MQDTRDSPSTTTDGIDDSYRAEPTLDAGAVLESDGSGPDMTIATGSTATGSTGAAAHASDDDSTGPTGIVSRYAEPLVALASGSPFVAAIAAIETVIATVLLGVPLSPAPAVIGLVAFAVYTVDHVADAAADARSTPERARIARRYGDQLMVGAALAYGLAVALATLGGPLAVGGALLPGAFWVASASDCLPNAGQVARSVAPDGGSDTAPRIPRLKEVPVLSSVVVAAGWALAVTLLPLAFASSAALGPASPDATPLGPAAAVAFAYFFLRSFVDAELPNVRDVEADAAAGVATLPIVLGIPRTRRVLYGVDLVAAATVAAATATGVLAPAVVAALGVGLSMSLAVTALAGRVESDAILGVAPDCSYLVVAVALATVAV